MSVCVIMHLYIARVKAKYDHYPPPNTDHLLFYTGTEIIVLGESEEFKGLWRGKIGQIEGLFPSHYVEEITEGT